LCIGAIAVQFLYYTFIVGGDHFEYRIYAHLVVPAYVVPLWLANRSRLRGGAVPVLLAAQVGLALPVPWSHWLLTRDKVSRAETRRLRVAIAPHWPAPCRGYARLFDALQDWLIGHWVCVRHQEHKVNQQYLASLYPARAEGEKLPAADFPVHAFQAVGVAAWSLPHVNIIDLLGLNDAVIARAPVDPSRFRGMAHEREAPAGYVQCFAPNVFLVPGGGVRIAARGEPLTADAIRGCEREWRARLR
jgi:arabinofuranosyltransferase